MSVRLGLDRVREEGLDLPGAGRCGLVANTASVSRDFVPSPEALRTVRGVQLDRLFSPQHGFAGEKQDNMVESAHGRHPRTGLPIWSLYGEVREPTAEMLAGLDAVLFDVPDVGTRVYTFLVTLLHVMRAAGKAGIPVYVLDRPNPIGPRIDGPILAPELCSFVGWSPVPLQHGLTAGEYALFGRQALGLDVEIVVVPMDGWNRDLAFEQTDLPWVLPSPNMPTLDTALVYPGGVLLEGTNLSEGRGTTRPFELFGAPWLDPVAVQASVGSAARASGVDLLRGALLREVAFEPTFHKYRGETVRGFQVHVTDRAAFRPVVVYVEIFRAIRACHASDFAWRQPPYEYEEVHLPIDLLTGRSEVRHAIDANRPTVELAHGWEADLARFREDVAPHLLYEGALR